MFMAVSPYHLTTRELPAMASLLLGEHVVTHMPAPFTGSGREQIERAVRLVPRYLRFMDSWRWSMPLWEKGVMTSWLEGQEPTDDMAWICRQIDTDDSLAPMRTLMRSEMFEDEVRFLDLLASDMLKGGPDPGVNVPVWAGLDRFATRHRLVVARAEPISIAQRAEGRLGERVFSFVTPVLVQGGGKVLLDARTELAPELEDVRAIVGDLADALGDDVAYDATAASRDIGSAATSLARAFEAVQEMLLTHRDEDGISPKVMMASFTGMVLPVDAVIRSSLAALQAVTASVLASDDTGEAAEGARLPVLYDELQGRRFLSITVRPVGRRLPRR